MCIVSSLFVRISFIIRCICCRCAGFFKVRVGLILVLCVSYFDRQAYRTGFSTGDNKFRMWAHRARVRSRTENIRYTDHSPRDRDIINTVTR